MMCALGGAALLALTVAPPAAEAQRAPSARNQQEAQDAPAARPQTSTGQTLLSRQQQQNRRKSPEQLARERAELAEQAKTEVQAVLTAAGNSCQVTEAWLLGQQGDDNVYEAACAAGPGFLVVASNPPSLTNCVVLAGAAEVQRSRDPAAEVPAGCTLPGNQNPLAVISVYAQEAGVPCTIDQGLAAGATASGAIVYEVGCNGADGYWVQRASDSDPWTKIECLQVVMQNGTCRYTTPAEQHATVQGWLAGTDAAACNVTQARFMGGNANGRFYEAKCAEEGVGFIARTNADHVVQQVYPCATAQRVGGGCTLTQVAALPAASAPAQ